LNKWRDYLDKRAADLLRWSNVVEDYDETILNPFLPEVNNPLWDYIENNLNEAKQKVVADFGCGNGKFVKFLCEEKKFENVYGIDLFSEDVPPTSSWCETTHLGLSLS
jgi:2-polyprenyl-3-methyl-5-hydroxy-6-metoxy-1,4-benzoquinol methylase